VSGPSDDERLRSFSEAAGIEYASAWHALCNAQGCLTHTAPSHVLVTDNVHLSEQGSRYLIEAMSSQLSLP